LSYIKTANLAQIKSIGEKALLENCLLNKEWAQKELYDMYSSELFAICWRYATDNNEAKDILQEAFIRIFTHLKQYNGSGSLIGWMKRVVVTTSLNYIKKHKKEITTPLDFSNETIQGDFDSTTSYMDTKEILKAFIQLSYPYRTILGLHIIEGYSYKEISQMLGLEETACRTRVHRAKLKLKEIIHFENNAIAIKNN
jgi:RNA polymerase sigma factor (sigma-70 family)